MKRVFSNLSAFFVVKIAFFACVLAVLGALSAPSVTHADSFSNISPNPNYMNAGGIDGGISHLLKNETVAHVTEINLGAYYPKGTGRSANGKSLQISQGTQGQACKIAGGMKGNILISISIANNIKPYSIPIQKVCGSSSQFFKEYAFPSGQLYDEAGYYMARIKIYYSNDITQGNSDENSVNFRAILKGDNSAKGVIAPLASNNAREYGLRSAWYTRVDQAGNDKVQARVQFGYPCDARPSQNQRTLKLYDADQVFGNTYIWITKNGRKLERNDYDQQRTSGDPDARVSWDSDNNRWKAADSNNTYNWVRMKDSIVNPEKGDSYEFVVFNDGVSSTFSPHSNVLSVSIPYDAIYSDVKCDKPIVGNPFDPVIKINKDIVEPDDDDPYTVTGSIKNGVVPSIPGKETPKIAYQLTKLIYAPGKQPFKGGTNKADPQWSGYYGNPDEYTVIDHGDNLRADYTVNPITEPFPPNWRVQDGSTVCYVLAVKQPPTVETHNYKYRNKTGTDKKGNPTYSNEIAASDNYYSDENHNHPNNFPNPSSGGKNYTKVDRDWKHAVDCVVVGKRPKVQILGSDLRVRGDTKTKVTLYRDAYFGSWVEYGTLTMGVDDAPASGAGYRNGTAVPPSNRSAWSKLTFANASGKYGGYTTLPTQPDIAGYYDRQSQAGGTPTWTGNTLTDKNGIYRNNGVINNLGGTNIEHTVILYATGPVTIGSDITYSTKNYTSVDDIPQVIIVAPKINILHNVGRIDAWLIAYDHSADKSQGNIDTCSDGPQANPQTLGQREADSCNFGLEINGPVVAAGLYLNRTGPTQYSASEAAEKFRLRPDAYLWAAARQQSTGAARTVDIVELPPRF
ncbi:MAG: hypothetical protein JWO61_259 [Candidatus Saccharibacteria bacterium]|nr:hypothetical protein [Candidatus Saccharibacteria bacterium]